MAYRKTTATNKIIGLEKRIRAVQGGTAASKTVSIILYLIARAQSDKKPTITSIVSESFPHLKRGAMRDFLAILQDHGYYNDERWNKTDYTYTFETGSIIEFFSADQAQKVRGPRRDRLFINEANNVAYETFDQLEIRTKEFVFLDWNPVSTFWFYEQGIDRRDDVDFITLTYLDNEANPPEIVKSIEQHKGDRNWWQVYGLGRLGTVEGIVYSGWQIINEIPFEARLERYGLDFGYNPDPAVIVAIYYYNGGYIVDEILYARGYDNSQLAQTFLNLPKALIIADRAEPKSIAEIAAFNLNIQPCTKGNDSVRQGIKVVQSQRMSITKQSTHVIKDYRNYMQAKDKDGNFIPGKYEHQFSHGMDAIRYPMTSIVPVKQREEWVATLPRTYRQPKANPAR